MNDKKQWLEIDKKMKDTSESIVLPLLDSFIVNNNFKGLSTILSRYKFASKMLEGRHKVLDIGCNAGFKTLMLQQFVDKVVGLDFDKEAIEFANKHYANNQFKFIYQDFLDNRNSFIDDEGKFDGCLSLDVIEHISSEKENLFIGNICKCLNKNGVCIIGTPNITASEYQSETSKMAHINLYSSDRLKNLMSHYFENVFLFGMNDEVVHTGFPQMSHYLIVMGVGVK